MSFMTKNGFFTAEFKYAYTDYKRLELKGNYKIKFTCCYPCDSIKDGNLSQKGDGDDEEKELINKSLNNFFVVVIQYHEKILNLK